MQCCVLCCRLLVRRIEVSAIAPPERYTLFAEPQKASTTPIKCGTPQKQIPDGTPRIRPLERIRSCARRVRTKPFEISQTGAYDSEVDRDDRSDLDCLLHAAAS